MVAANETEERVTMTCLLCDRKFEPETQIEQALKCHDRCLENLERVMFVVKTEGPRDD